MFYVFSCEKSKMYGFDVSLRRSAESGARSVFVINIKCAFYSHSPLCVPHLDYVVDDGKMVFSVNACLSAKLIQMHYRMSKFGHRTTSKIVCVTKRPPLNKEWIRTVRSFPFSDRYRLISLKLFFPCIKSISMGIFSPFFFFLFSLRWLFPLYETAACDRRMLL